MNAASRSDPVAGLDIFADDLNCYAGKVEYYQWKLVGEGSVLAPVLQPYPFQMKPAPARPATSSNTPYMPAGYEKPGSKGAPWWLQENLVFVPRPVWIVEGQSTDPYYNFGKVIMYFDKEMYRIYWKLVHNRAGEYFYTAMCGYHFVKNDETYSRGLPEHGDRRERQDQPRRARRPLPDARSSSGTGIRATSRCARSRA